MPSIAEDALVMRVGSERASWACSTAGGGGNERHDEGRRQQRPRRSRHSYQRSTSLGDRTRWEGNRAGSTAGLICVWRERGSTPAHSTTCVPRSRRPSASPATLVATMTMKKTKPDPFGLKPPSRQRALFCPAFSRAYARSGRSRRWGVVLLCCDCPGEAAGNN